MSLRIEVSLRKKLSPSRMEAVREIQSFAEHQALFFSERYGCAIHRFAFRVQNCEAYIPKLSFQEKSYVK